LELLCSGSLLFESVEADLDDAFELDWEELLGDCCSGVFGGAFFLKKSNIYLL